ncbi:hypothetical protein [Mechercharimyces sp. CAU 1602]|nr:hypothetical protein [Mechercharimyces sp. CAU 1602]MCS1350888.1 hypothetical protein [Mechercharimyces sp. CAU 1602]
MEASTIKIGEKQESPKLIDGYRLPNAIATEGECPFHDYFVD